MLKVDAIEYFGGKSKLIQAMGLKHRQSATLYPDRLPENVAMRLHLMVHTFRVKAANTVPRGRVADLKKRLRYVPETYGRDYSN